MNTTLKTLFLAASLGVMATVSMPSVAEEAPQALTAEQKAKMEKFAKRQAEEAKKEAEARALQPLPLSILKVEQNRGKPGVYLFDCNPDDMYNVSHIPGATMINVTEWKKLLPKDKENSYLIFYCVNRLCNVSWEVGTEALRMGYKNVYVMPDGIQGWVQAGMKYEGTGVDAVARQAEIDKKIQFEASGKSKGL